MCWLVANYDILTNCAQLVGYADRICGPESGRLWKTRGGRVAGVRSKRGAKSSVENTPNGSGVWVHKWIGHVTGSAKKIPIMCGKIAVVWQWPGIDGCACANFVSECRD
jgi:hypothetical protein